MFCLTIFIQTQLQEFNLFPACCYNGDRKEIGERWFDADKCVGYKCVYDPEDSDVDIVERISGMVYITYSVC